MERFQEPPDRPGVDRPGAIARNLTSGRQCLTKPICEPRQEQPQFMIVHDYAELNAVPHGVHSRM
jgi:hypothetical protein